MTVDSVTQTVKEVSVAMGVGCVGDSKAGSGTGKPASGCKPDDIAGFPGFLESEGASDDLQGLSRSLSGGRKARNGCKFVHSQVLRIRKEDNRLGEDDVREGLGGREKVAFVQVNTRMGVLFYARPILPSPLGTKAPIS